MHSTFAHPCTLPLHTHALYLCTPMHSTFAHPCTLPMHTHALYLYTHMHSTFEIFHTCILFSFFHSQFKKCRGSPRNLFHAAKQKDVAQVLVQAAGCNVNSTIPQENHKTAMHASAAAGDLQSLRFLWMVSAGEFLFWEVFL